MSELVFLLEEPSAKAMLEGLLPRFLPQNIAFRCFAFEGKQDLYKQLVRKIRGYRVPNTKFVVLRDQDAADCHDVKTEILNRCKQAGKRNILVRIACRELESWYLADLTAVEQGLRIPGLARLQGKAAYRTPDNIATPSKRLKKIAPTYQKIGGSRAIGPFLNLDNTRSRSFAVFVAGIKRLCAR